jgi:dTDP-4-dehydrorhamnose 3,5-epimerase
MTSKIQDVQLFKPDAFEDFRGDIYTTWDANEYPQLNWRLDKFSHSRKDVLRGLHGDFSTWKLINCLYGEFYLVVADNRLESPTYKQWEWHVLSATNRKQVLVPPGCGNAHFILSDNAVFHYKLAFDGTYNDVEKQFVIKWNDAEWNFEWPHNNPILFSRDK